MALFLACPLSAQSAVTPSVCSPSTDDAVNTHWTPPLDRTLISSSKESLLSLRDALERIATVAKIRLSYSTELIPGDRIVCFSPRGETVGTALSELLAGTGVTAVALANDHVVLTPKATVAERPSPPEMAPTMSVLEKMVVTESAMNPTERRQMTRQQVIDGRQLARQHASNLSGVLDGYVPGVWSWPQAPSAMVGSFASIRGASSFGLSYPKIYIDGIEVANPLLVTRFAADAVDRIEVIRGPQGSALYGTDAISGVVNITTRHEGAGADGDHAMLRTSAGVVQSNFAHGVMAQNHALTLVSGTPQRSADLNVSASTLGDFIPDGYSRDLLATGSARIVRSRSTFSATGRFFAQEAGSPTSPLLAHAPDSISLFQSQNSGPQSIHEYTLGTTAVFAPSDRWTHTFVAGVDGYRLSNVQGANSPIASAADSALRAAEGGAARGTFRATSALHLGDAEGTNATLTFSAEHGVYRGVLDGVRVTSGSTAVTMPTNTAGMLPIVGTTTTLPTHGEQNVTWQSNTGVTTQVVGSVANTLFASGGVRIERDSRLPNSQMAVLPMFGLAVVRDLGDFTVKLRTAYGEGIRPPSTFGHPVLSQMMYGTPQQPLGAERQAGTEAGFDVAFRHLLNLRVTRFDQLASGLIQQVSLAEGSNPVSRRVRYELENVGEIINRGWEMEAAANLGRLAITSTFSTVSSRVAQLAPGYNGDLMAGDRMLQVPARTAALNVAYTGRRWYATLGASRAFDWINYDELALSRAYASGTYPLQSLVGPQLRDYWRSYDGALRLRAAVSRDFRDMFTFEVSGENLLNYQFNEPDNVTIVPGRTIMTGIRVKF